MLSAFALDTFVAQGLSQLTKCNAPDSRGQRRQWVNVFILETIFKGRLLDSHRQWAQPAARLRG